MALEPSPVARSALGPALNGSAIPAGPSDAFLALCLAFSWTMYLFPNQLLERRIKSKSSAELRAQLVDDYIPGTYISSLIISVLLERGEPVESFREYIFRQLHSEHVTWRRAGLYYLALCYPDLAAKLEGFDAFQPTKEDQERLKEIESAPNDS